MFCFPTFFTFANKSGLTFIFLSWDDFILIRIRGKRLNFLSILRRLFSSYVLYSDSWYTSFSRPPLCNTVNITTKRKRNSYSPCRSMYDYDQLLNNSILAIFLFLPSKHRSISDYDQLLSILAATCWSFCHFLPLQKWANLIKLRNFL